MSPPKKDRNFPVGTGLSSDAQLAEIIASALRQDFGDTPSSIKQIGRLTSANLRAIKNWYDAKNAPSSRYLLILAQTSPTILRFILMQVGGEDLWDVFDMFQRNPPSFPMPSAPPVPPKKRRRSVTMDVTSASPQERKQWFLQQLENGVKTCATDLAAHWGITLRTARRDISDLLRDGGAIFRGSRRNGRYEALPASDPQPETSAPEPTPVKRRPGRPRKT